MSTVDKEDIRKILKLNLPDAVIKGTGVFRPAPTVAQEEAQQQPVTEQPIGEKT